ncbi:MAG: (deoxy)nucleoside triphosphate pyrophosphohydrolase [Nanoarchaeota archaeon]|nr:(deoxy)nucleoside triphosphate pyrophosphohydrolase [Nanoarchaeota archaeon]
MSSHILVTAAIIENAGKYLITQRLENEKSFPSLWEFPGGKVKPGEELRVCLEREILEELGIEIKAGDVFGKAYRTHNENHIEIVGFYCDHISKEIQHIEVQGHKWVYPNEMKDYDFCPAELFFVEKLNRS